MENKFYTPNIIEFHVGFEFEINFDSYIGDDINESDVWSKRIYMLDDHNYLKEHPVRVKYLDKKDIESFGFIYGEYCKAQLRGEIIEMYNKYSDIWTMHCIGEDYREKLFEGMIKNKSELKRLLIQLGIINE